MAKFNKSFFDKLDKYKDQKVHKVALIAQDSVKQSMQHDSRAGARTLSGGRVRAGSGHLSYGRPSPPGTPPGIYTGTLKKSITTKKIEDGRYRVGTNVKYAKMHEYGGLYGNRYYPARPFLRPVYLRLITK